MNPFEAAEYAVSLLLHAGFSLKYQSMKTEARYYCDSRYPDHVIRVATHKNDRGMPGLGRIVMRITFSSKAIPSYGFSHERVENLTAQAIGLYYLRLCGAVEYKGRQPCRTKVTKTPVPEIPINEKELRNV